MWVSNENACAISFEQKTCRKGCSKRWHILLKTAINRNAARPQKIPSNSGDEHLPDALSAVGVLNSDHDITNSIAHRRGVDARERNRESRIIPYICRSTLQNVVWVIRRFIIHERVYDLINIGWGNLNDTVRAERP